MLEPGRSYSAGNQYRYGFNGKENDNEVKGEGNQQDYGKRIYDPRLGRFLSVDPLFHSYPWYTPYQFAGNTPVFAIDLDGLEIRNAYYNYSEDGTRLALIKPDDNKIKRLADKVDEAISQLKNDDPALYNFANQFNIKVQGATKADVKKFGLGGNEAGFIRTDIKYDDQIMDPDSPPAYAYNELYGKDMWSKFKVANPEGASQFALDYKSEKIKVFTSRTTTVNEQNIYLDFNSMDDILSGRTTATDPTSGRSVTGEYGETTKHEIGHFLYGLLGIQFRDQTALGNSAADEKFADGLDATFDKDPKTQTNFSPFFFMRPPPKQTLIINHPNGTQTKSEINITPPPKKI